MRGRGPLTDRDRREILAFQRFLRDIPGPPTPGPLRTVPGWWLYAFGGPPPPEGLEREHPTAWPWPGHDLPRA